MEFTEIIRTRRTIRSFTKEKVKKEDLKLMIEMARLAPSGANRQPIKYICVSDEEYCEKLFECTKWAGYTAPRGVPTKEDAPTAYIIVLIDEEIRKDGDNDAAYAGENIVLTAHSKGIGSCIIGLLQRDKIKEIFNIGESLRIHTVIALGYPNQSSSYYDIEDSIKYYIDDENNFHVPKRTVEEIAKFI